MKEIYQLLSIGGRVLPRHWLPTILGRSNVIDYYRYMYIQLLLYNGTPLFLTPIGHDQVSRLKGHPHFRGRFYGGAGRIYTGVPAFHCATTCTCTCIIIIIV